MSTAVLSCEIEPVEAAFRRGIGAQPMGRYAMRRSSCFSTLQGITWQLGQDAKPLRRLLFSDASQRGNIRAVHRAMERHRARARGTRARPRPSARPPGGYRIDDLRMRNEQRFNLFRGNIFAAADDDVLLAVGNEKIAVVGGAANVAGAIPAPRQKHAFVQRRAGIADVKSGASCTEIAVIPCGDRPQRRRRESKPQRLSRTQWSAVQAALAPPPR